MMQTALQAIHIIAGVIVLVEALNKLERTTPFASGLTAHQRLVDGLKALAWMLLALGAAGALMGPLLVPMGVRSSATQLITHYEASLAEVFVLAGFAVLIVRTRVKEG